MHAGVAIAAHDRLGLERLARYGLRAPFALSRLARAPHGRLAYELKHILDDGTTHLLFEPLELLEKLAVLVPPPREHLVTWHGVLAPCASLRDQVVPPPPPAPPGACAGKRAFAAAQDRLGRPPQARLRRLRSSPALSAPARCASSR